MADPFSALGLAGNIITFVDFTWKLFSGAYTIYRSESGTSDKNAVLQVIAGNVRSLSGAVMVEHAHSQDLQSLAAETKRVAEQILNALENLKVNGSKSRWASLKVALKEVWSQSKINNLETTLSKLQAQVTAHVQHMMGYANATPRKLLTTDVKYHQEQDVRDHSRCQQSHQDQPPPQSGHEEADHHGGDDEGRVGRYEGSATR